jgi:hypothetical protein
MYYISRNQVAHEPQQQNQQQISPMQILDMYQKFAGGSPGSSSSIMGGGGQGMMVNDLAVNMPSMAGGGSGLGSGLSGMQSAPIMSEFSGAVPQTTSWLSSLFGSGGGGAGSGAGSAAGLGSLAAVGKFAAPIAMVFGMKGKDNLGPGGNMGENLTEWVKDIGAEGPQGFLLPWETDPILKWITDLFGI